MEQLSLLEQIESGRTVASFSQDELVLLAKELRAQILHTVSVRGGHLASSLGAVELIIALHRVFDTNSDKIIFDVGHQSYAHKLLTGRFSSFSTLRTQNGISGFPKREESVHDAFNTGHSGTSLSAALGMARARDLNHTNESVIAVIGDGALTSGLAYEALDDAGLSKTSMIVLLNDNGMSISQNVGALTQYLSNLRASHGYQAFKRNLSSSLDNSRFGRWLGNHMQSLKQRIKYFLLPNVLFESFGFTYLGPVDGHNISLMEETLKMAKNIQAPVIIHAITKKGKGYPPAEKAPQQFHGVAPFNLKTGEPVKKSTQNNSALFGEALTSLAEKNEKIIAITAAMPLSTGLASFGDRFPNRLFDVGIAEQHAVTMAAGMAVGGLRPVAAIYSSFLQRGYDQILHDVCLQNLPVVLAVDRAGLVGEDGETHQGAYDIAFLSAMPHMVLYSPGSQWELKEMLQFTLQRQEPCAIRYNRGVLCPALCDSPAPLQFGKWETLLTLSEVTVIASGSAAQPALEAARRTGSGFVNARFLHPLDEELLRQIAESSVVKHIITVEDGLRSAGFGVRVAARLSGTAIDVVSIGIPDTPVPHASMQEQWKECGMDTDSIVQRIKEWKNL